jgi:AbrB family looped-hinge helix DNA binding protein
MTKATPRNPNPSSGRARVHVGRRATVVIPAHIRKELGIEEGDDLRASIENGRIVLEPIAADPLERLRQAFAGCFEGVDIDKYISELRDEWEE